MQKYWTRPEQVFLKINVDGSFIRDTEKGGWGFVIRDSLGEVKMAGAAVQGSYLGYQTQGKRRPKHVSGV